MKRFGERLKKLRRDKDITQDNLAEYLGISYQAVSKWENGAGFPDITLLPAIAGFFGVSADYLLGIEQEKHLFHLDCLVIFLGEFQCLKKMD